MDLRLTYVTLGMSPMHDSPPIVAVLSLWALKAWTRTDRNLRLLSRLPMIDAQSASRWRTFLVGGKNLGPVALESMTQVHVHNKVQPELIAC